MENKLSRMTSAKSKVIIFYKDGKEVATAKVETGGSAVLSDLVVAAWRKLGKEFDGDPLQAFSFKAHLPHDSQGSVLMVNLMGELAK